MARQHLVVGEILAIPPIAIRVRDRLRPIDPVWAGALGAVMVAEGQRTPIEVCRLPGAQGYLLVSGGHRLEGARSAGLGTINAVVVDSNAIERRMREVSENLWRKGLGPIDRAAFVAELVKLEKMGGGVDPAQDARSFSAAARWGPREVREAGREGMDIVSVAYGWSDEVAADLGVTGRTIRRDLALHRNLLPDVADRIRKHPIASRAAVLRKLADLDDAGQRAFARMIGDEARTPAEAMAAIKGNCSKAASSPGEKPANTIKSNWTRLGREQACELVRHLLTTPRFLAALRDNGITGIPERGEP